MMKVLLVAVASLPGLLLVSPAVAQRCDGIEVGVGLHERRCLKPGKDQSFKDCADCPEMVLIPAGDFTMGSPPDEERHHGSSEREDQLRVGISTPFAVGRFAVTRGEFAAFVRATDHLIDSGCFILKEAMYKRDPDRSWRAPGFAQNDQHPVVCVSWNDARSYVAWLSSLTGKAYRLLSESEREYATRAGSTTPFWWGATISTDQANYNGNIKYGAGAEGEWRKATVPVDSFVANAWGLYNVHGNVWEWTEDCWNPGNAGNPGDGTARITGDCGLRVVRGGSWNNYPHTVRSARRYMNHPNNRADFVGFRVARTLQFR
jgi:formylglycine-generating enzyme required for sulfatase activity